MGIYVLFLALGLGSGAVVALLALGIVVAHRGSGVVNLAQGAMAMYVAYVYFDLRTQGLYFIPIPGVPSVSVGSSTGLPTAPAIIISLLTAVVIGLILHYGIFRLLRTARALGKAVAAVGVLLVLQGIVTYHFGTEPAAVPSLLPSGNAFRLSGAGVPTAQLILVGIAIFVSGVLWAFYKFTRFGLATRAAAENEKGASLLGYSPDFLAGTNWVLASVLAGIGGILIAPIAQLVPTGFTLLIIPALAAALIGKFTSFGMTTATAIVIGMVQSLLTELPNKVTWWPVAGTQDVFTLVLIVVVVFALGSRLPTRGDIGGGRLPFAPVSSRRSLAFGGIMFVVAIIIILTISGGLRVAVENSLLLTILCLSLVVLVGYVGQISLFQLCLSGVSAYILAELATNIGIPFPIAPLLAAIGAMLVGLLFGVPALRIRGINLAVITLAAGNALNSFFFDSPTYTGGIKGARVPPVSLFGWHIPSFRGNVIGTKQFTIFTLVIVTLVGIAVTNLRRSQSGRKMLAVRANERAATMSGVSVAGTKLMAFALAAFIAGIAGGMQAYQQVNIAGPFDILSSVAIFVIAYLGGITTANGAFIAGLIAAGGVLNYVLETYLFNGSANTLQIINIVSGLAVIILSIQNPSGISGTVRSQAEWLRQRLKASSSPETTAAPPPDGIPTPAVAPTPQVSPIGPEGATLP